MSEVPESHHKYPVNSIPFEAFYNGSWHEADNIRIKDGYAIARINYHGSVVEQQLDGECLRMHSRRATIEDCLPLLKPGVDVCVFSARQYANTPGHMLASPFIWHDGKVMSVKGTNERRTAYLINVVVYGNSGKKKRRDDWWSEVVPIDNVAILQKLRSEACEDGFHVWNYTEDSFSATRSKLFSDLFSSEASWLVVMSRLKGMIFDLQLLQNNILFCIRSSDHEDGFVPDQAEDAPNIVSSNSQTTIRIMRFQRCSENLRPKIETVAVMPPLDIILPPKETEPRPAAICLDSDSDVEIIYEKKGLRHSKRLKALNDQGINYKEQDTDDSDSDSIKDIIPYIGQEALEEEVFEEEALEEESPVEYHGESNQVSVRSKKRRSDSEYTLPHSVPRSGFSKRSEKQNPVLSPHIVHDGASKLYRRRLKRRKLLNTAACKEMIERCMDDIQNEIDNQLVPFLQPRTNETDFADETEDFNWSPTNNQEEIEEHHDLWKEMEQALTTISLLERKQNGAFSAGIGDESCQHDYYIDDEIGKICRLCKFVNTEIRNISAPFSRFEGLFTSKEKLSLDKLEQYWTELDPAGYGSSPWEISLLEGCQNVWSLIPDLEPKLHSHQRRAFEFLWRNTAGSIKTKEINHLQDKTGGCVISHSPGSGKTLLIISFLVSFLKVYPRCRPMILAPKSAIHTWVKEFQKWKVPLPVYRILTERDLTGFNFKMSSICTSRRTSRLAHIMDCLEKLRKWHEQPSILLMNYSSFLCFARANPKREHTNFMASIFQNSPGVMVLDEGHNPRSTRSKLRKLLMNVKTEFRIFLSGTLFQNNFEEYFNSLSLARPRFVNDVIAELDPRSIFRKRKRTQTRNSNEILARKLFVERVGRNIESTLPKERKQGFDFLSKITSGFIDFYEGSLNDMLPGLQIYTLLLKSTELQGEILLRLQKVVPQKRYPLELELLITVGSIHPCLIKTVSCAGNFFDEDELKRIERCKENFRCGSKAKFVVDLVHKATVRRERVLIFCHNIAPLHFLVELFELVFGWKKGEEVLVLQGDQELPVRANIIEKFNADVGGQSKVLLASTTACAEGISLTAASRLVMLDSEWNHSKTRQAIARAFRPGQMKFVYVYLLVASGTWEEDKYKSNLRKAWKANMILNGRYIEYNSSREVEHIVDEVLQEVVDEDKNETIHTIMQPG